jgi:uncharacterized OsmC-like protein
MFYKQALKNFAKIQKYTTTNVHEAGKLTTTLSKGVTIDNRSPPEGLLGLLGACKVHSIEYQAKIRKVPIEKITIECKGEYDSEHFMGLKKEGRNTYEFINIETTIQSSEKDKKKLEEAVHKGEEHCPVLNTLKYAGIKITTKYNYL